MTFVLRDVYGYYYQSDNTFACPDQKMATQFVSRIDANTLKKAFNKDTPSDKWEVIEVESDDA